MDPMDIISPPRTQFSSRKRSWGDDQFERPSVSSTTQFRSSLNLLATETHDPYSSSGETAVCGAHTICPESSFRVECAARRGGNGTAMCSTVSGASLIILQILDEPQRQRSIHRLPLRHVSQSMPALFASALAPSVPHAPVAPSLAPPPAAETEPNSIRLPPQASSSTKKRFAMGPRSDCDRCRAGEPGHYGHWL